MSKELLITLPKRGLRVIPPAETRWNMERARAGEIVSWSDEERVRLRALRDCSILAKRYPTPEEGRKFMVEVDYEWREELLEMARELSANIVEHWRKIDPNENIAVLLFGSVAKGLVKHPHSVDPSNIDLAVIGHISDDKRRELFDRIRPKRQVIQQRILSHCPYLDYDVDDKNPGNAGVIIQDLSKLRKNGYEPAMKYIASNAFALHDPGNIWRQVEKRAIEAWRNSRKRRRQKESLGSRQ